MNDAREDGDREESRVVCPFCWKMLRDTLTGTTHVKTCAKNIPIQQVFEAMQLQKKQIEEWTKLGITFPGFNQTTAKKSTGDNRPRRINDGGKGDADMELALALSMSLQEEYESRRAKENQYLIECGLENEVQLAPLFTPGQGETRRRRGKKTPVEDLPLYTTNTEQKRAIISDRVATILDESENQIKKNQVSSFCVRDALLVGVPESLSSLQNMNCTLWRAAQGATQAIKHQSDDQGAIEWPYERVVQDISKMLLNGTASDITIRGGGGTSVPCHRFMLLARCPSLLDKEVIEQISENQTRHVIPLTSYTDQTVNDFLWYIYTGRVKSSNEKIFAELKELGAEYGIDVDHADHDDETGKSIKRRKIGTGSSANSPSRPSLAAACWPTDTDSLGWGDDSDDSFLLNMPDELLAG